MRVLLFLLIPFLASCQIHSSSKLYSSLKDASAVILVDGQLSGSGAFISEDGLVLSAAHIFLKKANYKIVDVDDVSYPLEIIAIDRSSDLALLKVEAEKKFKHLELSEQKAEPGDSIFNFGAAFFRRGMMQQGQVAEDGTSFEFYGGGSKHGVEVYHISTTLQPGTSGGPWVNTKGEVVGLQSGIMKIKASNSGLAYSAPLKKIRALVSNEKSACTTTIEVVPETLWNQGPNVIRAYKDRKGVVLVNVFENGAAAKAGLKKDDLIMSVNDQEIKTDKDFYFAVRAVEAGEKASFKIYRPSEKKELIIKVKTISLEKRFIL